MLCSHYPPALNSPFTSCHFMIKKLELNVPYINSAKHIYHDKDPIQEKPYTSMFRDPKRNKKTELYHSRAEKTFTTNSGFLTCSRPQFNHNLQWNYPYKRAYLP